GADQRPVRARPELVADRGAPAVVALGRAQPRRRDRRSTAAWGAAAPGAVAPGAGLLGADCPVAEPDRAGALGARAGARRESVRPRRRHIHWSPSLSAARSPDSAPSSWKPHP